MDKRVITIVMLVFLMGLNGCTAYKMGSTLEKHRNRMLSVTQGDGVQRFSMEMETDSLLRKYVIENGTPDYIYMTGSYIQADVAVHLLYIDKDYQAVFHKGLSPDSKNVTRVAPISDAMAVRLPDHVNRQLLAARKATAKPSEAGQEQYKIPDNRYFDGMQARPQDIKEKAAGELVITSTGSGFIVNETGSIVTNYHVVDGCEKVSVRLNGKQKSATWVGGDATIDLAVIRAKGNYYQTALFSSADDVVLGEDIVVAGFPLHGLLSESLNVSTGAVSALAGLQDNTSHFQITAPIQPGNSGGPVIDQHGRVVGVVTAKLNELAAIKNYGMVPQNVNFAIKGIFLRSILSIHKVQYYSVGDAVSHKTSEIAKRAKNYVVSVECWKHG